MLDTSDFDKFYAEIESSLQADSPGMSRRWIDWLIEGFREEFERWNQPTYPLHPDSGGSIGRPGICG